MSAIAVRLSYFEAGVLLGMLEREGHWEPNAPLYKLYEQLVSIKKQVEKSAGVKKERLPDGRIRSVDQDGNIITRPPYKWETLEG